MAETDLESQSRAFPLHHAVLFIAGIPTCCSPKMKVSFILFYKQEVFLCHVFTHSVKNMIYSLNTFYLFFSDAIGKELGFFNRIKY